MALSILTYDNESLSLNKSQITSLDHQWSGAFMKIYSTFDLHIVKECQAFGGFLPLNHLIINKMCFLSKLASTNNGLLHLLYDFKSCEEISHIAGDYSSSPLNFNLSYRTVIHDTFEAELVSA